MEWTVEVLNGTVSKELDALSADIRARFVRICELLERAGPRRVGRPYVRHLTGPLWEIRKKHPAGKLTWRCNALKKY